MTKLVPVAHRLIIKPDKLEEEQMLDRQFEELAKSRFSVVKPDGQDKREKRGVTTGTVVSIGWMAWRIFQGDNENWRPWCKVGDRVEFARYAGEMIYHPDTGEELFVLNDEDILLVHETEAQ